MMTILIIVASSAISNAAERHTCNVLVRTAGDDGFSDDDNDDDDDSDDNYHRSILCITNAAQQVPSSSLSRRQATLNVTTIASAS